MNEVETAVCRLANHRLSRHRFAPGLSEEWSPPHCLPAVCPWRYRAAKKSVPRHSQAKGGAGGDWLEASHRMDTPRELFECRAVAQKGPEMSEEKHLRLRTEQVCGNEAAETRKRETDE